VSHLAAVFKLDKKGFNLRRGASVLVVALIPLVVNSGETHNLTQCAPKTRL